MFSLRAVLKKEIEQKERRLKLLRDKLRKLEAKERKTNPAGRFIGIRPVIAAKRLLKEHGPLSRSELTELMIAGGITIGKKRGHHNVRIGLDKAIALGNLLCSDAGVMALPVSGGMDDV